MCRMLCLLTAMLTTQCLVAEEPTPQTIELHPALQQQLQALDAKLAQGPQDVRFYSQRGDVHFFLGNFQAALSDYDKMLELDPDLLALHWRRGLAQFYVGKYAESARQFERYYEQDQSDRENGIWRYYAQVRQLGLDEARRKLLTYVKPDRLPLPDVYDMCAGKLTPAELEARLTPADVPTAGQSQRDFYGHLYLGLEYAIRDQYEPAKTHLDKAIASEWAQQAGYGPNYMWHIARLQRDLVGSVDTPSKPGDPAKPVTPKRPGD